MAGKFAAPTGVGTDNVLGVILLLRFFVTAMNKHFIQSVYPLAATVVGKCKGKQTGQILCRLPDRWQRYIQVHMRNDRIQFGCHHIQAPVSKSSPTRRAVLRLNK
jgi:hypothetical protein